MAEEKIKARQNRAIKAAARILSDGGSDVMLLKNHIFHIEAIRSKETRKIRIVVDSISEHDKELVTNYFFPSSQYTKEIWCRKGKEFDIMSIP